MKSTAKSSLFFSFIYLFVLAIVYKFECDFKKKELIKEHTNIISLQKITIVKQIEDLIRHTRLLRRDISFERFLSNPNEKNRAELEDFFKTNIRLLSNDYFQFRYLDKNGMEKIRVNRIGDNIFSTRIDKLQNKATENYFQQASTLDEDTYYYISKLDLNREFGVVEKPYRPTLRAVKKIVNSSGDVLGYFVINFDARAFLRLMTSEGLALSSEFSLVNEKGEYLIDTSSKKREWQNSLNSIKDHLFLSEGFDINNKQFGVNVSRGLFSFYPIDSEDIARNVQINLEFGKIKWDEKWILVHQSYPKLYRFGSYKITLHLLLLVFGIGIIIVLSRLLARSKDKQTMYKLINETTLKTASSAILTIDEFGTILYVNESCEKVFEYSSEELIGQNVKVLVAEPHASKHDGYLKNYKKVIGSKLRDVYARRKNGDVFKAEISISMMEISKEKLFVACVEDKSLEEMYHQDSLSKEIDLKNQNNLMALLAHDLKSPLSTIYSISEHLLESKNKLDKETIELVAMVKQISNNNLKIVRSLLSAKRTSKGKMILSKEEIVLEELILEIINETSYQASTKGITTRHILDSDIKIKGDRSLLRECIINIISNSIKFCDTGDYINIKVYNKTKDIVCIVLEDTGPGISDDKFLTIFEEKGMQVSKGTNGEEGTGFGLPFSSQIVHAHNGNITCSNTTDGGARFIISLPCLKDE